MTTIKKDDIIAAYDAMFGRGWKSEFARAHGIDTTQISRANAPTLRVLLLALEWMQATPEIAWPARYDGLKEMMEEKKKGSAA